MQIFLPESLLLTLFLPRAIRADAIGIWTSKWQVLLSEIALDLEPVPLARRRAIIWLIRTSFVRTGRTLVCVLLS